MTQPHHQRRFAYKPFQREDLARAILCDGCILSWDTGLGKTIAAFSLGLLKLGYTVDSAGHLTTKAAALLVAPGGLHRQIQEEGRRLFGQAVTVLDKEIFSKLRTWDPLERRFKVPAGFYLVSYTALGRNGMESPPNPDKDPTQAVMDRLRVTWRDVEEDWQESFRILSAEYSTQLLAGSAPDHAPTPWSQLSDADRERHAIVVCHRRLGVVLQKVDLAPEVADPHRMRCVWDSSLADDCMDSFDCVVVDEGTRLKGESFLAAGVLRLRPKYRYVLTATPIKNRLPDMFQLAWWACGGSRVATARFPWAPGDKDDFADRFCQRMTQIDEKTGRRKRGGWSRLTPQVANVHALWKLNGSVVIRRRKRDSGVDIPAKHRHVIRVPMGMAQAQAYKAELQRSDVRAGAKLAHLRSISSMGLPKHMVALSLIEQILRQNRQAVVFSAFNGPLHSLQARLQEAGISPLVLTHEVTEKRRGERAARFASGPVTGGEPVLLAGIECMSEGHNFPLCQNVIFLDYSLAANCMTQADDRIHRITSREEVHSWRIITSGTVDLALEALDGEKHDAAELVLDGSLTGASIDEVSPARILRESELGFATAEIQDEEELRLAWVDLRERLRLAMAHWPGASTAATGVIATKTPAAAVDPVSDLLRLAELLL